MVLGLSVKDALQPTHMQRTFPDDKGDVEEASAECCFPPQLVSWQGLIAIYRQQFSLFCQTLKRLKGDYGGHVVLFDTLLLQWEMFYQGLMGEEMFYISTRPSW